MEKNVKAVQNLPIELLLNSEVTAIEGEGRAQRAIIYNNQTLERTVLEVDSIIVQVGYAPNIETATKGAAELLCYGTAVVVEDEKE